MYDTSEAFQSAIRAATRKVRVYISLGKDIDATAADDITAIDAPSLPFGDTEQLFDAVYSLDENFATFEGLGIPTAVSHGLIAPPLEPTPYPPASAVWSDVIGDATGAMDWTMAISLSSEHTSALTLYFGAVFATDFTVTFRVGETVTGTSAVTGNAEATWSDRIARTYDNIVLHVTGVSRAWSHLRLAEVEFGASYALAGSDLAGSVSLLREHDPTTARSPAGELTFSLNNVRGAFDPDHPDGLLARMSLGLPVDLSFTVDLAEGRETVPMGRYYITERSFFGSLARITAQDIRGPMGQTYPALTLGTSDSIGEMLDGILVAEGIPHLVPVGLYSMYLDREFAYDGDASLLDILTWLGHKTGWVMVVRRDGTLSFASAASPGDYGMLSKGNMFDYPKLQSPTSYNAVTVLMADGVSYTHDMRTDPSATMLALTVRSPMITTTAERDALVARVVAGLHPQTVKVPFQGDPCIDPGDLVKAPTRHTDDALHLPLMTVTGIETTYGGSYREVLRGSY
jgi:hypothetical protein